MARLVTCVVRIFNNNILLLLIHVRLLSIILLLLDVIINMLDDNIIVLISVSYTHLDVYKRQVHTVLRDLAVALSACIYQSLCDSDSCSVKQAVDG